MISAIDISKFLSKPLFGPDKLIVDKVSKLDSIIDNSIVFAKKYSDYNIDLLNENSKILAIVPIEYKGLLNCSYIISDNPRLDFIKTISHFFPSINKPKTIHHTAIIEEGAIISNGVYIGPYCYISSNSYIGSDTILHSHVVVDNGSTVGDNCEFKSGVVIGQSGFGFERENNGMPIRFPHYGKVKIGNNVYIGANTTIDQGTLGDTIIEDNVKIDNLVHIAHNCHIQNGAFIIAGSVLGGGTKVGTNCWLAPNVTIKEQTTINSKSLIGLGAVVLKDVESETVVVGNPARILNKSL